MDIKVKWNMFITSFIPLWITIVLSDLWDIMGYILVRWNNRDNLQFDFQDALRRFLEANLLTFVTIIVICILVITSVIGLNGFLKKKEQEENTLRGRLLRVSRANKLSAEFLLAYILPMVAFDFSKGKGVMLFVVYFLILAYLCIRNNNIYTNIYLELKRYRMYECDVECRVANGYKIYPDSLVISRRDLTTRSGDDMKYWDFDNYVYIDLER